MVMMLLIMELWVGPTLAAANNCLALIHIFQAPPAQLVMRDPPNDCSILILKPTVTHLFFLIATPPPVLGSFHPYSTHFRPSVHQHFSLEIGDLHSFHQLAIQRLVVAFHHLH